MRCGKTRTLDFMATAPAATRPAPQLSITEQLAYSTVRIETDAGTGTGFFYRFAAQDSGWHIPAIVTNKHVIEGASKGRFLISRAQPDGMPDLRRHETYAFGDFSKVWTPHPSNDIDLCAMPLAPILSRAENAQVSLFYRTIDATLIPTPSELEELNPVEDITMVGYPNGLWDEVHNMPIFRRGITATHPKLGWNGKPEFLIDAACFPGSSGSPVFLLNEGGYFSKKGLNIGGVRIKLLGVLYAGPQHTIEGEIKIVTVPTQNKPIALSTIPNNLGIVIRATALHALDTVFLASAKANNEI
jgi:trypsin-like peptidase